MDENTQILKELQERVEQAIKEEEAKEAAKDSVDAPVDTAASEETRAFADDINSRMSEIEKQLEEERNKRLAVEQELQLQVVSQTMGEIRSFTDGLVKEGRLVPALQGQANTLLSVAANLDGNVKSYALDDEIEDGEMTPYSLVCELLKGLPAVSTLKNKATASADRDVRRFSAVNGDADAMHEEIKRVQKEEGLSYIQAFEKVRTAGQGN